MGACVAVDIGAGSGRVIRAWLDGGRLEMAEVHRFDNAMQFADGHLRWDADTLFAQVGAGLKKAGAAGPIDSIGVDTWGVDFVLLDGDGGLLEPPVAYRDARTDGVMEAFFARMPREEIYARTGIQFQSFNTLYQLAAMEGASILDRAARLLLMGDYLNYRLCGVAANEFTSATTTQMLNLRTADWDTDILRAAGVRPALLDTPIQPGTALGALAGDLAQAPGLERAIVYAVASHDTGSAVAAVPAEGEGWAYISSGTWCLMGIESPEPVATTAALAANFTNEGGVCGTWRLLKNLMGLWLVRGLRDSFGGGVTYEELLAEAALAAPYARIIHANDMRFLHPASMREAFDDFFRSTHQPLPATRGEYVRCAEEGLGFMFREVAEQLRAVQPRPIQRIHILGGGTRDGMMCQMAADATGLPVLAGPAEGTAVGNVLVQLMAQGKLANLAEARRVVRGSFPMREYAPAGSDAWDTAWERYREVKRRA